jgi:hypothetical protein
MLTNKTIGKCALVAMSISGAFMLYANSARGYETIEDQIYLGSTWDQGNVLTFYDPEKEEDWTIRGNPAKLGLDSDESLKKPLDLIAKTPRIGPRRVVDATPSEE